MNAPVRIERDGDIAVVIIDNPPVNASSAAVRDGLLAAIDTVRSDTGLRGAVLIGAGNTFVAGADLREFGQPLAEPALPAVIRAIEDCGKPVVAAPHGAALGGGFELALGCDARVAAPGTVVGLPEVTLGIIPGAGGTQRLPRIVGIPRAIGMICSGERVSSAAALAAGLIDEEAAGDLRAAAVAKARQLGGHKQRLRDRAVPAADAAAVAAAEAAALKAGKHRPAVQAAIDVITAAARVSIDDGLADERALFQRLHIADRLCEAGRLGRKTGAGYYRYAEGASRPQVDAAVHALIDQARRDKGITPRALADAEIQRRALLALVNEAALLLGEGVAERATDVDVVLVNGYGFPRWEGGPVFWSHERGVGALQADLDELAAVSGAGFVRGEVRHLLQGGH